jgi:hypothetical protein
VFIDISPLSGPRNIEEWVWGVKQKGLQMSWAGIRLDIDDPIFYAMFKIDQTRKENYRWT